MKDGKYEEGDLLVTDCDGTKDCPHGEYWSDDAVPCLRIYGRPPGTFFLPHQCDEWVIGSREDAIKLWKALEEALGK